MTHFDDLADAMYDDDLSLQEANRISRQRDCEAKYSGDGPRSHDEIQDELEWINEQEQLRNEEEDESW